jgi:hypothetical protein
MPRYYGRRRYAYGPSPGWGWGGWGPPPWVFAPYGPEPFWEEAPYESSQEEIANLKEQEVSLGKELEAIQKRLTELEKKD